MKTKIGKTVWDYQRDAKNKMERDLIVCSDFKALRKDFPEANVTTLCTSLAYKYIHEEKPKIYPKTSVGISDILKRHGLYQSQCRKDKSKKTKR